MNTSGCNCSQALAIVVVPSNREFRISERYAADHLLSPTPAPAK